MATRHRADTRVCESIAVTFDGNDYRVPHPNGREASAYYTGDRADALGTARLMWGNANLQLRICAVREHPNLPAPGPQTERQMRRSHAASAAGNSVVMHWRRRQILTKRMLDWGDETIYRVPFSGPADHDAVARAVSARFPPAQTSSTELVRLEGRLAIVREYVSIGD